MLGIILIKLQQLINGIHSKCDVSEILNVNQGNTLGTLKKIVRDIMGAEYAKSVVHIHYRYQLIHVGYQCVEYRAPKLDDDHDMQEMFFVFFKYASLELIELCIDLVRSNEEIITYFRIRLSTKSSSFDQTWEINHFR